MRFLKLVFLLMGVLIAALAIGQGKSGRVVAFAQDTMKNDFRQAQVFEVRDAVARVPGLSFAYSDAQGQTSLLIHQIEQFIE